MTATLRTPLHMPVKIVFYREDGLWIAHCLEFDLLGDGETRAAALESLSEAIAIQVEQTFESGNVRNLFHPAPAEFFEMYARGRIVSDAGLHLAMHMADGIEIPTEGLREYAEADLLAV